MASMARPPPSQQPVAMPMPSGSVESVTRRMPASASTTVRSRVSPPSGTVQTVAMPRACMALSTSADQS